MDNIIEQHDSINWQTVQQETTTLLQQYLQFDTSNPPGNEVEAIQFLAEIAHQRNFTPKILLSAPKRANLIVRLAGTGDNPPILLYAHADVVPVDSSEWSVPPFGGVLKDGYVYGRGALDDKSLGIIFLQAITLLKQTGAPLKRDIILCIAADEETNSRYGIRWLLDNHIDLIRAEYVWDEGGLALQLPGTPPTFIYAISVADKRPILLKLTAYGTAGHSSFPSADNPQDQLVGALHRLNQWRFPARLTPTVTTMLKALAPYQTFPRSKLFANADSPVVWPWLKPILQKSGFFVPLISNTLNLTTLQGGQVNNAIPAHVEAHLDLRLLPDEKLNRVMATLRAVINDPHILLEIVNRPPHTHVSPVETEFFDTLHTTLTRLAPEGPIIPYLNPGATDARFFRQMGMKAYGLLPMLLTSEELQRIHGIDERVSTKNLKWGVQVVFDLLWRLCV